MNFDRFNKWTTLFANVGVLIGIVFLVIEIQQNTAATEAAMRESVNAKDITFLSLSIDQSILAKGHSNLQNNLPVSPIEESQLIREQYINFIIFEHTYHQFEKEIIDESEWARHANIAKINLETNIYSRKMFALHKNTFSKEFTKLLENWSPEQTE